MQFVYSLYNYTVYIYSLYAVCIWFTQWNAFNVDMHLRPASPLRAIHLDGIGIEHTTLEAADFF